jgi:Protein of unknown function (DUF3237)
MLTAPTPPQCTWVYDAVVDIDDRVQDLGASALGQRFMIGIAGGTFEGPRLRGRVLPGGADRQWLRPDGVKELDALYEMQTEDGAIITVRNRVLIDDPTGPHRYARSVVRLTAPDGPHEWLNRRVFVGTLTSLRPEKQAVLISVFMLA